MSFWVPLSDKTAVITNLCRWDQAFRIYSKIYLEGNAGRAAEIIQYSHIIHEAAIDFPWESVYAYDREFRAHMGKHPTSSWAIILQQAWTLKMKRNQPGEGTQAAATGNTPVGDKGMRKKVCWPFNFGNCMYGMSCKFEHRCLICNKWGHGAQNCRKVKGNRSVGRKRVNYAQSEDKKNSPVKG